jgi:hypothetical protein
VQRDRDGIAARARGNAWRAERGHELLPALPAGGYCDHLTPITLTALRNLEEAKRRIEAWRRDYNDASWCPTSLCA